MLLRHKPWCLQIFILFIVGHLSACPGPESDAGPGPSLDGGDAGLSPEPQPSDDAGLDAGLIDGGRDAGEADAGRADAGPEDGGSDAGPSDAGQDCGGCEDGLVCCAGSCVDVTSDPTHCGACDVSCSDTEFCAATSGCAALHLSNLCMAQRAIRIDDGQVEDVVSSAVIAQVLEEECSFATPFASHSQNDQSVIDPATSRPLTGVGSLMLLAGGSFFQTALGYLEQTEDVPVISVTTADTERLLLRGGGTIVDIPKAAVTPSHDFFVVQIANEPVSGTLVLSAYGMFTPGTRAAAYYFSEVMLPNLATIDEQYFIFEWTDDDGDEIPNAGDSYVLIASG